MEDSKGSQVKHTIDLIMKSIENYMEDQNWHRAEWLKCWEQEIFSEIGESLQNHTLTKNMSQRALAKFLNAVVGDRVLFRPSERAQAFVFLREVNSNLMGDAEIKKVFDHFKQPWSLDEIKSTFRARYASENMVVPF